MVTKAYDKYIAQGSILQLNLSYKIQQKWSDNIRRNRNTNNNNLQILDILGETFHEVHIFIGAIFLNSFSRTQQFQCLPPPNMVSQFFLIVFVFAKH